jgi:hypothetical protein
VTIFGESSLCEQGKVFDLPKVGFELTDPAKSRDRFRTQSQS